MLVVELKRLHKEAGPAAKFLLPRIDGKLRLKGSQVQIEGAKAKEVKLLLRKFLHHRGLNGYKVLSQSGVLEVFPPQERRPSEREALEGGSGALSPFSPYRTSLSSYIYPNYPPPPQRKYKRAKS